MDDAGSSTDGGRKLRGRHSADLRVHVGRPHSAYFRYTGPSELVAKEAASRPRTRAGRGVARTRAVMFGRPLSIHDEATERLNVFTGLSVFASDNISSSAYATEEIMRVLRAGRRRRARADDADHGRHRRRAAIVVISYQQTIAAYPNGGGSYIVASDNLGRCPGLTAAAALLTDYVLTVAVSIAAGVAALTSIFPGCSTAASRIGVGLVVVARRWSTCAASARADSSSACPTYVYLVAIFGLLALRLVPLRDRHAARLPAAGRRG